MKKNFVFMLMCVVCASVEAQYAHYSEWMTYSEMKRVEHPYYLDFSSSPKWSYVMGIEMESMLDTYLMYGGDEIISYLKEYPEKMISSTGSITGYKYSDFNLDNVRTGRFILRMYNMFRESKDSVAIETLLKQLENQPRTEAGPWYHKAIYANQVWLDGIYMGLPFYTMVAPQLRGGSEDKYYADAVMQMKATDERTYDAETNLWKHAWDETHSIFWADATTGQSQHTWGRALGWFAMAFVEVLDVMPETYEGREELVGIFRDIMSSVVDYQDAESGVWYDVMDVVDSRNYLEATCSAMFTYCLLKGARLGYLDETYREAGVKAYRGMIDEFVVENHDGTISLQKCVSVSGLGPESNPKRDGSFEYYMSESVRDNDAKGVGPFVWASLEMERLGYTVDNLDDDMTAVTVLKVEGEEGTSYDLQGRVVGENGRGMVLSRGRKVVR